MLQVQLDYFQHYICIKKQKRNDNLLNKKLTIKQDEIKNGSGIIKNNLKKHTYTIRELVYLSLKESDNTAYIKLVNEIPKEKLISFEKSLNARHTLEGKDFFGTINASDALIYLENVYKYFQSLTPLSQELKIHDRPNL